MKYTGKTSVTLQTSEFDTIKIEDTNSELITLTVKDDLGFAVIPITKNQAVHLGLLLQKFGEFKQ